MKRSYYILRGMFRWLLPLSLSAMSLFAADRIQVHGHRGARAARPENTLPAFEYAIQAGVDMLELDVAVTKDNVLVVSHDPRLNAHICQGPNVGAAIHSLTLKEVKQHDCGALKNAQFPQQQPVPGTRIPTLDEVLSLAPKGSFGFNIETKSFVDQPDLTPPPDVFAKMLWDAVRKHKLESRVVIQSFDFRTLQALAKIAPESKRSALWAGRPRSFVAIAQEANAQMISPHYLLVSKEQVKLAHDEGLQVIPWTANTPADWDKLTQAGVDAIITDDPAALIAYIRNR